MKRALVAASVAVLLAVAARPRGAAFTPGSAGAGDPFFPLAGNGGYDVRHYSLRLDYEPQNNALDARAVISARATQDLSRFDLDLRGLHVGQVTVDGDPAAFKRDGQELVITPAAGIRKGRAFEVAVDYDGHPNPIIDPDKSKDGWIPTDDGAFVVNEPQGSPSWYPANDTPKDKATYDFAITVPEGRTAIANGLLVGTTDNGDDHDVALARKRSDGALPGHRHQRRLRDRLRDACRTGCRSTTRSTRRRAASGPRTRTRSSPGSGSRSTGRRSTCSRSCTGGTRSRASAASWTGRRTSSTRSSRRRGRCTGTSRPRPQWCTRSRTCGSATRSRWRSGLTSG